MKAFAERLNTVMVEAGLSQVMLAEKSGCSTASISQYIHGRNIPTPKKMQALADALAVTVDYLLGNEAKEIAEKEFTIPPGMKPITLRQASACLHMADKNVKEGISNGTLPIGRVICLSGKKARILITPEKLREEVGMARFNEFFGITT